MELKGIAKLMLYAAGVYDIVLGLAFLFFAAQIYSMFGIPLPADIVYLQGGAIFTTIFGIAFFLGAMNLERNKDLYVVAMIFKAAYSTFAFYNYFFMNLKYTPFLVFAGLDLIALLVLAISFKSVYSKNA